MSNITVYVILGIAKAEAYIWYVEHFAIQTPLRCYDAVDRSFYSSAKLKTVWILLASPLILISKFFCDQMKKVCHDIAQMP